MRRYGLMMIVTVLLTAVTNSAVTIAQSTDRPLPPLAGNSTDLGNGFEVLYLYAGGVIDGLSDGPILLGELRNMGDHPAVAPMLRIGLLDQAGTVLGTVDAMPLALYAPPGARVPIVVDALSFRNGAPGLTLGGWANESISVCDTGKTLGEVDPAGLDVGAITYTIDAAVDPGTFGIVGSVTNHTGGSAPYLDVVAAFYAADGRFVGFDSAAVLTGVASGAEAAFALGSLNYSHLDGLAPDERSTPVTWDLIVRREQRFQTATCGGPIT